MLKWEIFILCHPWRHEGPWRQVWQLWCCCSWDLGGQNKIVIFFNKREIWIYVWINIFLVSPCFVIFSLFFMDRIFEFRIHEAFLYFQLIYTNISSREACLVRPASLPCRKNLDIFLCLKYWRSSKHVFFIYLHCTCMVLSKQKYASSVDPSINLIHVLVALFLFLYQWPRN